MKIEKIRECDVCLNWLHRKWHRLKNENKQSWLSTFSYNSYTYLYYHKTNNKYLKVNNLLFGFAKRSSFDFQKFEIHLQIMKISLEILKYSTSHKFRKRNDFLLVTCLNFFENGRILPMKHYCILVLVLFHNNLQQ